MWVLSGLGFARCRSVSPWGTRPPHRRRAPNGDFHLHEVLAVSRLRFVQKNPKRKTSASRDVCLGSRMSRLFFSPVLWSSPGVLSSPNSTTGSGLLHRRAVNEDRVWHSAYTGSQTHEVNKPRPVNKQHDMNTNQCSSICQLQATSASHLPAPPQECLFVDWNLSLIMLMEYGIRFGKLWKLGCFVKTPKNIK